MKKLVLLGLALSAFSVFASGTSTTFFGIDDDRQECSLTIEGDGSYTLKASGYTFVNLLATDGEWGTKIFEDITMDHGDNVYLRVIGSPITISKIGILEVKGILYQDGSNFPTAYTLKAQGGLLNWFRKQFVCSQLK